MRACFFVAGFHLGKARHVRDLDVLDQVISRCSKQGRFSESLSRHDCGSSEKLTIFDLGGCLRQRREDCKPHQWQAFVDQALERAMESGLQLKSVSFSVQKALMKGRPMK